jgi:hypothetical protein
MIRPFVRRYEWLILADDMSNSHGCHNAAAESIDLQEPSVALLIWEDLLGLPVNGKRITRLSSPYSSIVTFS